MENKDVKKDDVKIYKRGESSNSRDFIERGDKANDLAKQREKEGVTIETFPDKDVSVTEPITDNNPIVAPQQNVDTNNNASTDIDLQQQQQQRVETDNKILARVQDEYGKDDNVVLGRDGRYYYAGAGGPYRISNDDGSINLKDGTILDLAGNVISKDDFNNKYDLQTKEGRLNKAADEIQAKYNELRDYYGDEDIPREKLQTYLGFDVKKFNKHYGLPGSFFITESTLDKLDENYKKINDSNNIDRYVNTSMSSTRDNRGNIRSNMPISKIHGQQLYRSDALAFENDIKGFLYNNPDGILNQEQINSLANVLSKYGIAVPKEISGTAAGVLSEIMKDGDVARFVDMTNVNVGPEGITFDEPPIDIDAQLQTDRLKKEYKTKQRLDEKEAERRKHMENFSQIFQNIGDTIRAAYGAKVFNRDGGKSVYDTIDADLRQKTMNYEAKLEALRQEALAEKQRQEAINLKNDIREDTQRHEEFMDDKKTARQWGIINENYRKKKEEEERNNKNKKNDMMEFSDVASDTKVRIPKNNREGLYSEAMNILSNSFRSDILKELSSNFKEDSTPMDQLNYYFGLARKGKDIFNKETYANYLDLAKEAGIEYAEYAIDTPRGGSSEEKKMIKNRKNKAIKEFNQIIVDKINNEFLYRADLLGDIVDREGNDLKWDGQKFVISGSSENEGDDIPEIPGSAVEF